MEPHFFYSANNIFLLLEYSIVSSTDALCLFLLGSLEAAKNARSTGQFSKAAQLFYKVCRPLTNTDRFYASYSRSFSRYPVLSSLSAAEHKFGSI